MCKAIILPKKVYRLTILKVKLLVHLKDQKLLYPAYLQPEWSATVPDNTF